MAGYAYWKIGPGPAGVLGVEAIAVGTLAVVALS